MKNKTFFFSAAVLVFISLFFLIQAIFNIATIPFAEFDEAHRAEGARNMRLLHFFLAPLTGTPYNAPGAFALPFPSDPDKKIAPEKGRPPLVFLAMAFSSSLFGDYEWAYRLPSFLFGLLGLASVFFFIYFFDSRKSWPAVFVALLSFLTAYDWWHSLQMAHLDTGLSFFLSSALFLLILFGQNHQMPTLFLSGAFLACAILAKGQPAVIFLFPLFYLLAIKKIKFKEAFYLLGTAFLVLLPWVISFDCRFGWGRWFLTYVYPYAAHPQSTKIGAFDPSQKAPVFWYLRWWFDTFRPGIILFGAFLLRDLIKKELNFVKVALLFYIFGGLAIFSFSQSKVWWYVLPIIPAVCAYLYFSIKDYLKSHPAGTINLSLIVFLSSLPVFLFQTNTIALAYGFLATLLAFILLNGKLADYKLIKGLGKETRNLWLMFSAIFSLFLFYSHFPQPTPIYPQTKIVGQYYASLPSPKCLLIEEELPYEAILYYSRAGRVWYWLDMQDEPRRNCSYYLLAAHDIHLGELIFSVGPLRLYRLSANAHP